MSRALVRSFCAAGLATLSIASSAAYADSAQPSQEKAKLEAMWNDMTMNMARSRPTLGHECFAAEGYCGDSMIIRDRITGELMSLTTFRGATPNGQRMGCVTQPTLDERRCFYPDVTLRTHELYEPKTKKWIKQDW